MLPDTVEYGEWQHGTRIESLSFGLMSFVQKVSFGMAAVLLGFLLEWAGYTANMPQSPATLEAVKAIMTLLPAGFPSGCDRHSANLSVDRSHASLHRPRTGGQKGHRIIARITTGGCARFMNAEPSLNQREKQRLKTRGQILDAALEIFAEKGFDATSVREIAAKVGINHALIRHHFQNKEELWKEAVTFLFDRMYAELAVEPGSEDHLSNFERLKNRIRR